MNLNYWVWKVSMFHKFIIVGFVFKYNAFNININVAHLIDFIGWL